MKKVITIFFSIALAAALCFGCFGLWVAAEDDNKKILENFEAYSSTEELREIYQNYQYAGEKSIIDLNTAAENSNGGTGKSLKITSSMESGQKENAAFSVSTLTFEKGFKGISFWIKNPGPYSFGIYPQFAYGPMPKASSPYQVKADGKAEFVDLTTTEEQYYNIRIDAGFAGEIRIPFNSFTAPVTSFEPILFIAWGEENPFTAVYSFYIDDIGVYGIAEEAPIEAIAPNNDYEILDNFDNVEDATPTDCGYLQYEYGNAETSLKFVDYGEGRALEVGNAAKSERADFVKTFAWNAEAKGISMYVENRSGVDLAFNPQIDYVQSPVLGREYFIKSEGSEDYSKVAAGGSSYYPLNIEAGFKGEIALPFTVYGGVETLENMVFQLYGPASEYTIIFDNFSLYGVVSGRTVALDNFDSYADDQAVTDAGYGLYPYGSSDSAFELIEDEQGGKALKLMNFKGEPSGGQDNQRIDIQKTFTALDGAKGISIHIQNKSDEKISMGFVINYGYFNQALTGTHYVKLDGEEAFSEGIVTTNPYYAIELPANFSGTVRMPIELFTAIYNPLICVIQFYAESTDYYEVIVDDIELYGLPEQAIEPLDVISTIQVTSKLYGFVPQLADEVFSMQLACVGYNINNELRENHTYEFTLQTNAEGVTLTKSGLLTVTSQASLGEIKVLAKVVYDADGSYGIELAFTMNLSLGESELTTVGIKKAPPESSDKDYFVFR